MARILEIDRVGAPSLAPRAVEAARLAPDPRVDEVLALLRTRSPAECPESSSALTLGELWERVGPGWMARVKPATQAGIEGVFKSRILPKWGSTRVDEIRNSNLSEWYRTFLDSAPHYGATATKKVIQLLKLGHEEELVESLPVFKIRYIKSEPRKPLEQQAVCRLVEVLEGLLRQQPGHVNANAIIAIMNTGERARAGLSLHTREVNYKEMCITKKRKFDQVKKIPISDYTAKFLRSIQPAGAGYFFPNRRDPSIPIKYGALLQFFKALCAKHGIVTVDGSIPTIHCMRHTYATLLEEQGLPVSHIQRLLGHSSIQSTLRYVHGSGSAAREGANRLQVTRVRVGKNT
ncbi:MAG: tyrosine-type recombinase/integrase [Nannocystaceae bacterium]